MRDTDIKCWCGGAVEVKDWRRNVTDRDFRYEARCTKCGACDPNGYSSIAITLAGAREYFEGQNAQAQGRLPRKGTMTTDTAKTGQASPAAPCSAHPVGQALIDRYGAMPHVRVGGLTTFGRSWDHITCPWCGCECIAYVWSLAGSGKRCPQCRALHTNYGVTKPPNTSISGGGTPSV